MKEKPIFRVRDVITAEQYHALLIPMERIKETLKATDNQFTYNMVKTGHATRPYKILQVIKNKESLEDEL